jgi:hypothetical protein
VAQATGVKKCLNFSDDLFLGPPKRTWYGQPSLYPPPLLAVLVALLLTDFGTVTAVGAGAPIVVGMYVDGTSVTDGATSLLLALAQVALVLTR